MNKQASVEMDFEVGSWTMYAVAAILCGGVLLVPTPAGMTVEGQRLTAITLLMAVFWIAQPIPIAVTSFLPLALYPLLGILSAADVSRAYSDHNVFLFLGGFILAMAIERCGLHQRIALHIVSRVGSSPRLIILGFMLTTALLSMWISNTATTMLMLPIALALLSTLRAATQNGNDSTDDKRTDENEEAIQKMTSPLLLGIAYAASCGGFSTFVGTPTNVSLRGFWERTFVSQGAENLSMAEWMMVFVPLSAMMLLAAWIVMTWSVTPLPNAKQLGKSFFRDRLHKLGKASPTERKVFVLFLITAILWITRKPLEFDTVQVLPDWPSGVNWLASQLGWKADALTSMVQDSTIAMFMATLLFIIPGETNLRGKRRPLMVWSETQPALPWGMLLLIGSGFAMADAFQATKLSDWLGLHIAVLFEGQHVVVLVLGVCLMVTFLTEFTTNVATVNTILPTLAAMSVQLDIDPRLLLIPATISASCAFMLPVATPPNAIVFASGLVPIREMVRYGIILNLIGAVLVTAITFTLATRVMNIQV